MASNQNKKDEKLEALKVSSSVNGQGIPEERDFFNINPDCESLIKEGKCKADCCGNVMFPERYFMLLKKFINPKAVYQLHKYKVDGEIFVKPITTDFKCVFLSDDLACNIFGSNLRPEYCHNFGSNRTEPLFSCAHINEDKKELIQEFALTYLKALAQRGNPLAKDMLPQEGTK